MGIFRHCRTWFRGVWFELGQRWYCWRQGVVPVAASVWVWSITIDDEELLVRPVPGTAFNGAELVPGAFIPVVAGSEISIRVENLSNRIVPFQACLSVQESECSWRMYPFPIIQLASKGDPFPSTRPALRVMQAGRIYQLLIPAYARIA